MAKHAQRVHLSPTHWVWIAIGLSASFVLGFGVSRYAGGGAIADDPIALRDTSDVYQYIEPLLACGIGDNKNFAEYSALKDSVNGIITSEKSAGKAQDVSVYFRDLNSGKWMGIGQNDMYAPASLDKITLLMAYLKEADKNPSVLDRSYVFPGTRAAGTPDYTPMTVGKSYTVRELLQRLIVNSDNDAKDMLHEHIDQGLVNDVFSDLGLSAPALSDRGDSMSAKSYSLFFRTLYNGTYLSRDNSELALQMLTEVIFKDGLTAGLPANVTVAHKFGYRVFNPPVSGVSAELHDCGIVYNGPKPYFICVMTKGRNYQDLASVIQDISKYIYQAQK